MATIADYVKYFNPALAGHRAWMTTALEQLVALDPGALEEGGRLRQLWLAAEKPRPAAGGGKVLEVPYFSQMDNEHDADGPAWRQCASSTCAMVAAYYGKVKNDEEYKDVRFKYGSTTNPNAHVSALRALGLDAELRQNASLQDLKDEVSAGRPVPVGWLHHGPAGAPTGGGHWSLVIGMRDGGSVHHDPYGRADLRHGGYISRGVGDGRGIVYPHSQWVPRWNVKGSPPDGWMIVVKG